ncbi:MAG: YebC/PmpR family DNA-binding transcriptional regulator [Planctomycetes bacterium]|nr:YebC/PmpR family DNA-binding transcriptional regulator [Planctomycetota bacterium]
MAGHSAWKNIKHRKAAVDAKRGKIWSKLGRAVTVAARAGGADPKFNSALRLAILDAKAGNMPRDTIERAVKKGAGGADSERFEPTRYEGFGPGGVAIVVEALVANANRTAPEIKTLFDKNGGKIGVPNSVMFGFVQQGILLISKEAAGEDALLEIALAAGADDVAGEEEGWQVTTEPASFGAVREAVEAAGIAVESAQIEYVPLNTVSVDAPTLQTVEKLVEALEDHDDVQRVHTNLSRD